MPIGKATTLLVEVLGLLCKGMVSAGCSWSCQLMGLGAGSLPGGGLAGLGVKPLCVWGPGSAPWCVRELGAAGFGMGSSSTRG